MSGLREIQVGRGLGITKVQLVDLVTIGKGAVFHIVEEGEPLCGVSGMTKWLERDVDAKVVAHRGKPVCLRCRERLGDVPMPYLLLPPISS